MSISVGLRRVVEVFLDLLQGHEHDAVPAREAEEHRVESFEEGLGPLILQYLLGYRCVRSRHG